jgi:hypothetical protein
MTDEIAKLQAELRQEKVARLQAENALEAVKRDNISGQGSARRQGPSKEELAQYLQAKVAITPLNEIMAYEAERKGKTIDDLVRSD